MKRGFWFKFGFIIFAVAILPIVLAWCLFYGVIIGIVGITVDRYEYVRKIIKQDVICRIKYPSWQKEKWEASLLGNTNNAKERNELETAIKEGRRKPPGMLGDIIINILLFSIIFYPFLLIWGIVTGPIRAGIEYYKWCYKTINGYSIYAKEVW
ncbi:MAG: hypothetical protein FD145_1079 [Candidatus Saganbacteria bacterium]|uniref:Uncharacterized protein n=1 Tax=Candidatus Saganbacteria bacterium TaxID=2575572 RepID=A0A833L0S2_UNCSA|nr:MAG: hypothetical protein FD145_1079 [Candidatus Saganbacteria bacterium]